MSAKYKVIAHQLTVPGEQMTCTGVVIASSKAIIVIPERIKSATAAGMAAAGGAIGAVLGAMAAPSQCRVLAKNVAVLPSALVDDADWPVRQKPKQAVVFFKEKVKYLRYPWWGAMSFEVGGETIRVTPFFIFRPSVVKTLREFGWKFH